MAKQPAARNSRRFWISALVLAALFAVAFAKIPVFSVLAWVTLVVAGVFLVSGLFLALWRRLLWRVGRRLAFSYFLIGVLPIPLLAALLGVGGYLLSGFFLAHLFRESVTGLYAEVTSAAVVAADAYEQADVRSGSPKGDIELVYYRAGRRIGEHEIAPAEWPIWLEEETRYAINSETNNVLPPLIQTPAQQITVAAAVGKDQLGVLALHRDDLTDDLRRRSRIWVELVRPGDRDNRVATLQLFDSEWTLMPLQRTETATNLEDFYTVDGERPRWFVVGLEAAGPLYDFASGEEVTPEVSATVFAPFSTVTNNLFSRSSEVDTIAWISFIIPAFLLFDIYLIALILASYLAFGLSRAVNHLSRATDYVRQSDFSHRIKVRRLDQVGDLQRDFNEMTAHLETLVHNAAEQEILAKELEIAQELQKGLLPKEIDVGDALDVACYFEPSTVIGGDYYDLLRMPEERQRVAIIHADVSGHGLPAGLRMAMIKSALDILVRERKNIEEILQALDATVRSSGDRRSFVTASICLLDLDLGTLEITNAGHPPTYLIRGGEVTEITLPGSPLGTLGTDYAHRSVRLERQDVLVWLSDGLIEATNDDDLAFGYDGILETLADGPTDSAKVVRDRVIEAVRRHCAGRPADDDRTMVVLRYLGPASSGESRPISIV